MYGLTLESIDHSVRFVSSILPPLPDHHYGYGDSGFYPTGIGGPESSLLGSSLGDLEPGIAGPLGFDALSNAAGMVKYYIHFNYTSIISVSVIIIIIALTHCVSLRIQFILSSSSISPQSSGVLGGFVCD